MSFKDDSDSNEAEILVVEDSPTRALMLKLKFLNEELKEANEDLHREIEARKLAEAERLKVAKLEGALEMAGAVCHELNQPLQVILSNSGRFSQNGQIKSNLF